MNHRPNNSTFLFSLLVIVNLLNFIDRGIIPGAILEFNLFIQDSINTDSPDVFLGLLVSVTFLLFKLNFEFLEILF